LDRHLKLSAYFREIRAFLEQSLSEIIRAIRQFCRASIRSLPVSFWSSVNAKLTKSTLLFFSLQFRFVR
jgi:hypothetical protein